MASPRQIATVLGLCALSCGLFYASTLAEDQPIVVWGEPSETALVQPSDPGSDDEPLDQPSEGQPSAGTAAQKPTKPAPGADKAVAKATAKPAAKPVAVAAKPAASAAPVTAVASKAPAKPAASAAPVKPAAKPPLKAAPPAPVMPAAVAAVPGPNAVPLNPTGGRIPASTPERLAAMAKQSAGRVDPFVSLELPAAASSGAPPIPAPPVGKGPLPRPTAPPQPTPGDGMVVTGIITSAKESVAIVAAEGRSRLVQVGDTLPGGIRVMSINPQGKSVIVSHGGRSARLAVKE